MGIYIRSLPLVAETRISPDVFTCDVSITAPPDVTAHNLTPVCKTPSGGRVENYSSILSITATPDVTAHNLTPVCETPSGGRMENQP